jgi:predicted permease
MSNLWRDIRYALRQLSKAPGFTLTIIVTLALGIGMSTAMFTVVDGVLLRPLPVPHSSEIVALGEANSTGDVGTSSLPDVRDWRAYGKCFQDIAWYRQSFFNLKKEDGSVQFSVNAQTSPNFFSMLQVHPWMGRTFLPKEGTGAGTGSAVLSYYVWKNNFHSDPSILGKPVELGANTYVVIGVMPHHFYIPINDNGPVVWTVLTNTPDMEHRDNGLFNVIGRLRPDVTIATARTELSSIQSNIAKQYASQHLRKNVAVTDYRDTLIGSVRIALLAMQGAVLAVWLIACANIAGLILTRMTTRRREIAIRTALGSPRKRIVQQFLIENLFLGLCGGILGLGIAMGSLILLRHSINFFLSRSQEIALNSHVLLLLSLFSVVSAMIFGTIPTLEAMSTDPQEALQESSRGTKIGRNQLYFRNTLIIGELALSLVLLDSAGLMLRTLYALHQVNLGFNQTHLVIGEFFPKNSALVSGALGNKSGIDIRETTYKPLLDKVQQLPGVQSAALLTAAPLSPNVHMNDTFAVIGYPSENEANRSAQVHVVTPSVYSTLQIRLIQGRLFEEQDSLGTTPVAVVNEAFAHTYLGTQPIGKRLNLDLGYSSKSILQEVSVIGVVENTPQDTLGQPAEPEIDIDMYQIPIGDDFYSIFSFAMQLAVRTKQSPQLLVPSVSRILSQAGTSILINRVQTMQERIDGLLGSQIFAARLLWIFAIAAVVIASAGLYGLLSYNVSQRTRDIGVQFALGAQRDDILWLILRHTFWLVGIGISLGIIGAYLSARLLRSFLYGVGQHDMITIAAGSILLTSVSLLASYIPAHKAANIEPLEALREE